MIFNYRFLYDQKGKSLLRKERIFIEATNPNDEILRAIRINGTFYEHDLLLHLAHAGLRGGLFIDVGANIGNHSIYFAKFLADHVVCVEPSIELQGVLKNNLEANKLTNYSLIRCGAGASFGYGELVYPLDKRSKMGMARIECTSGPQDKHSKNNYVKVRTIDSIVKNLDSSLRSLPVKLIKIDVEGMQLDVLKGARFVLESQRPQLIVEANDHKEQDELNSFLREFGYEPVGKFCSTPTFHYVDRRVHKLRQKSIGCKFARTIPEILRLPGKIKRTIAYYGMNNAVNRIFSKLKPSRR